MAVVLALKAGGAVAEEVGGEDLDRMWGDDSGADTRTAETPVPRVPWESVEDLLYNRWEPGQHASVWGSTGSGKTHLQAHLLRSVWPDSKVLIVDSKNGDDCLDLLGRPCDKYPPNSVKHAWQKFGEGRNLPTLFDEHHRLVVVDPLRKRGGHHGISEAKEQVSAAIRHAYQERDHVVYLDEIRDLTDQRAPGLGLLPLIDSLYRRGRYRNVTVIGGSQAPRWAPSSAYDQVTWCWIGQMSDGRVRDRLDELGGDTHRIERALRTLRKREFLLVHEGRDMLITRAPAERADTRPDEFKRRVRAALKG